MNHWPFILAAYGIAIGGTLVLAGLSFTAMCRAEKAADSLRKRP